MVSPWLQSHQCSGKSKGGCASCKGLNDKYKLPALCHSCFKSTEALYTPKLLYGVSTTYVGNIGFGHKDTLAKLHRLNQSSRCRQISKLKNTNRLCLADENQIGFLIENYKCQLEIYILITIE